MFSELNFPFSLIGLSEITFKVDKEPLTNINIQGYSFISQPSISNAGGVAVHFLRILQWWGKTAKGPIFLALHPGLYVIAKDVSQVPQTRGGMPPRKFLKFWSLK
jgi:hypothetical protein